MTLVFICLLMVNISSTYIFRTSILSLVLQLFDQFLICVLLFIFLLLPIIFKLMGRKVIVYRELSESWKQMKFSF